MRIQGALALMVLATGGPAAMAQTDSSSNSVLTYQQQLAPQGVKQVQTRLRQLGLYQGRIDGNWGSDSEAALDRFQQTRGLLVTGQLNQATMKTLDVDAAAILDIESGSSVAPDQAADSNDEHSKQNLNISPKVIQAVQSRLHQLNFDPGPADGIWGATTQSALKRFQQVRALQPTGQLNPPTVDALGINTNSLLPQASQR